MAGMKSWLNKIKNRILKRNLNDNLIKSKIQSDDKNANEFAKEKELSDLITPINEMIDNTSCEEKKENEVCKPRKEAMKVNKILNGKMLVNNTVNIKNQHFKPVPECRRNRNRWLC